MPINDQQTTNRQHAVPQEIMDVEFKIIGSMTMREFSYIASFAVFGWLVASNYSGPLSWILGLLVALMGLILAKGEIEGRGIDKWIINFAKAVYSPHQRIWRKTPAELLAFSTGGLDSVRQELITLAPTSSRRKLEEYLNTQDSVKVEDPLDIPEASYIQMVKNAFAEGGLPLEPQNQKMVSTSVAIEEKIQDDRDTETREVTNKPEELTVEDQDVTKKVVQETQPKEQVKRKQPQQEIRMPNETQVSLTPITPDMLTGRRFTSLLPKQGEIVLPVRGERILDFAREERLEEEINEKTEQLNQLIEQIKREEHKEQRTIETTQKEPEATTTPQVEEPEIINTQKQIATTPDTNTRERIEKERERVEEESRKQLKQLKQENEDLTRKIEDLKKALLNTNNSDKQAVQKKQQEITALQEQKKENVSLYLRLREQISRFSLGGLKEDSRKPIEQKENKTNQKSEPVIIDRTNEANRKEEKHQHKMTDADEIKKNVEERNVSQAQPTALKREDTNYNQMTNIQPDQQSTQTTTVKATFADPTGLTTKPNVISGQVQTQEGQPVVSLVLIIKNMNGSPVRALQTDKIGHFMISTPLSDGMYTIETPKGGKSKYSFDIIKIEATGSTIPPLKIIAKEIQG